MADPVRVALDELADRDAVRRLHDRDASLWSDDAAVQEKVAQRLGWLDVAAEPTGWADRLRAFADEVRAEGLRRVVLAGMGGSSLAPEVLASVLGPSERGGLPLEVLDSTHPAAVEARLGDVDATLVLVASKSGSTEETRDFGLLAAERVTSPRQLVAITDPGSQLETEAVDGGWRTTFANPADIGGRFSALSFFGTVPAALLGIDLDALWGSGARMLAATRATGDLVANPAAVLGAFLAGHARAGRDKLTLVAPPALAPLGDWVEQLVAESTGKQGTGVVPVVGEPLAAPDRYGDDRAFVALSLGGARVHGIDALSAAGFPVLELAVEDRLDLGGEFVRWEAATALAGVILGIDPFDEPNVSESKRNTVQVLDDLAAGAPLPDDDDGDPRALLAELGAGDYLCVQAYVAPTAGSVGALAAFRTTVRDRARVATTVGIGPRFLHSTGQLHKGGPPSVVALQLVDRVAGGPVIPGRPYDFATLLRAQALGDHRSLRAHGRRVARVHVDGEDGLGRVLDALLGAR